MNSVQSAAAPAASHVRTVITLDAVAAAVGAMKLVALYALTPVTARTFVECDSGVSCRSSYDAAHVSVYRPADVRAAVGATGAVSPHTAPCAASVMTPPDTVQRAHARPCV